MRSGQKANVGRVVNLEHKVATLHDNLPPRPRGLPVLLISRPTREGWRKKSSLSPIVLNRGRLIAAFDRLVKSHVEYMGEKRPFLSNLDKYYAPQDGGDVVLDVETRAPLDCDESHAGRDVFLAWLRNDSFVCAAAVLRWVRTREASHPGCDLWDVVRRELQDIFSLDVPRRQAARARGPLRSRRRGLRNLYPGRV